MKESRKYRIKKNPSSTSRRKFLGCIGLASAGAYVSTSFLNGCISQDYSDGLRPNVVFIMTDQQRYDSLGCNGNSNAITPNIDDLAHRGVCFRSSYVSQPVCSPCRSSILTGLFPHKTGVIDNNITLVNHSTSFPKILHQAGYKTCYIGKWHLGPKGGRNTVEPPPDYFDVWQGYDTGASFWIGNQKGKWNVPGNSLDEIPNFDKNPGRYRTDMETDQAIEFIRENKGGPFFLWLSIYPPHGPWTAPIENCLKFKGKVTYPTYYGMVNRIDENVGRLTKAIDELGIRENTIIVYTSDHGHNFVHKWNDHGKRLCYDTASNVPLIFNWKNHFDVGIRNQLISHVDLAPTILELCNVELIRDLQGKSAKALLNGTIDRWRDAVFIQNRPYKQPERGMFERCVVTDEWKLILNTDRKPELYNRKQDIREVNNVYDKPELKKVKDELFDRLENWAWEVDDGLTLSGWLLGKWKT